MSDTGRVKGGATVDGYIKRQPESYRPALRALCAIARKAVPSLEERIMWGQPVFVLGKEKIAYVSVISDHVNLGFFNGATLEDPKGRLEGTGKGMRHIKVRSPKDIDSAYFTALVRQAVRKAGKG